ncbi:MAG: amidohydrolase family protein, partial [Acidobacteriota bacterium]|nr:amidohydrolase family protein [Acidobacteriota bacterium]
RGHQTEFGSRGRMRTLIRNGRVALGDRLEASDLLLEGGLIAAVGQNLGAADRVVDASGCYVLPGFMDFHTHVGDRIGDFELADDYDSGTRIGILNGITTLCTFVTQGSDGSPETLRQALQRARTRANGRCHADVAWHLTPTTFEPEDWRDLESLIKAGYRTLKFYTTYKSAGLFTDQARLEALFRRLGPAGARFLVHCEDDELLASVDTSSLDLSRASSHARLRPEAAESRTVDALITLAARCGVPLHVVHVSTVSAAKRIKEAHDHQDLTSETCPQYLWLDESWLDRGDGHRWICSPSLRGGRDQFRELAREGVFDLIATDHCAFCCADKDDWDKKDIRTVANGLGGLGALAHLAWKLWEDDPDRAAQELALRLAMNPAARLGMSHRKGSLRVGLEADVVILDPKSPAQPIRSSFADTFEPYPGFTSTLAFRQVFLRGESIVEGGELMHADRPLGRALQGPA